MAKEHHYGLSSSTGKWTLGACIIASSMAFIDTSALNVVLPSLQEDLNATGTDLFWVLNSYLVMLSSLIIVGGSLGDKLGRVKIFQWGIILFTVSSILCGISTSIDQLIWFRILQGTGGAFMIPGSLAIISATFSDQEKGKAIGTWSAATVLVTMGGPILGGALADIGLWRLIFFINVPLGVICAIVLYLKVPESKAPENKHRIDWKGAFFLAFSLATFTFGFLNIPELGISDVKSFIPLIIGVISFLLFLYVEKRVNAPMMPLGIFKNMTFSGVNLLTFFLYAGLSAVMLFLSLNMIQIQGYTQMQAGLTFLPFTILMALIARRVGSLSDKWGARNFLIGGPIVTAVGFLALGLVGKTSGIEEFWGTFFPGILLFGLGMSLTVVPLTSTVMQSIGNDRAGIASGVNNSITRISGTFINAVLGAGAVYFFSLLVSNEIETLQVSKQIANSIIEESINFGEAKVPSDVASNNIGAVEQIYTSSFITAYRWVCYISAVMAFLASGFAFFMVKEPSKK
ncbi:drug resistance transporter, EmrB/QacA subfamily [Marivirga sericea]|uniref:Drug resistance transporter, EmrB/QacA subfamily n=1 Tax=Marivirga sericea TaxID=1028 RepID=A0A1X7J353_9BACT|nr:MFS transporter [Marivirga sericea]SMG21902.1 drug resistance transporter, EmrB/QacA subfamily [Marivirga sericea]